MAITRKTIEMNAEGKAPGRIATQIAMRLIGKSKPGFTPHIDSGDFVMVKNAGKLLFTGRKLEQKDYLHHTMYPGGLKRAPMKHIFEGDPAEVIRRAVFGMLPKNKHRVARMRRLKIES